MTKLYTPKMKKSDGTFEAIYLPQSSVRGLQDSLDEKQSVLSSSNKLSADYVDATSTTNKFVTASEKTTWNSKQDAIIVTSEPSDASLGKLIYEKTTTPDYTFNLTKSAYTSGTSGKKWYSSYSYTAATYTEYTFTDGTTTATSTVAFNTSLTKTYTVVLDSVTYTITTSGSDIVLSDGTTTYTSSTTESVTTVVIGETTYTITTASQTSSTVGKHTIQYNFWNFNFDTTDSCYMTYILNSGADLFQTLSYASSSNTFTGTTTQSTYKITSTVSSTLGLSGIGTISITLIDIGGDLTTLKIKWLGIGTSALTSTTVYNNGVLDGLHIQNLKIGDGTSFIPVQELLGLSLSYEGTTLNITIPS